MHEHAEQTLLAELAERCGIAPEYCDVMGRRHGTTPWTQRALLRAMGVACDTIEDLRHELTRLEEEPWRRACDPVLVQGAEAPGSWAFRMPVSDGSEARVEIAWELRDESGAVCRTGTQGPGLTASAHRLLDGRRVARFDLPLPHGLEPGYYTLWARGCAGEAAMEGSLRLIVAPARCYTPSWIARDERTWGVAAQLYAIRSARNWGAGDFTDLCTLVDWAADAGAGLVGLNPLHALKNTRPYHISPYSPDSRLYLNVLYVDIEAVPDLAYAEGAQRLLEDESFQARLEGLRKTDLVDYERVSVAKLLILELLFAAFEKAPEAAVRRAAFDRFISGEGEPLQHFALFQALSETMRRQAPQARSWRDWPEPYRSPRAPAVAAFRAAQASRVRFYMYLQWIAAEQLARAASRARAAGMPVGLYHDLAVGNDRDGADGWTFQEVLALEADCGAPPDLLGPDGQNWGLPPFDPGRLRAAAYGPFIHLLRRNMRYGGALRLDHVMALFRFFWIPRGGKASEGAYVRYPAADLLGILALESVRHRVVVVGEDLGTVPDHVREALAACGALSYRVLYFERDADGRFLPPERYPAEAAAVVTTHDLPTLAGYWAGEDIELRSTLGLYPDESARRRAQEERRRDKAKLLEALAAASLLPEDLRDARETAMTPALCQAIHAYLGRTPARLMLATLEDLAGERAQVNLPGTVDSHPNWSRKIRPVDDLRHEDRAARVSGILRELRPRPCP